LCPPFGKGGREQRAILLVSLPPLHKGGGEAGGINISGMALLLSSGIMIPPVSPLGCSHYDFNQFCIVLKSFSETTPRVRGDGKRAKRINILYATMNRNELGL